MNFLQNKNILVTGAGGLVGINALSRLKDVPGLKVKAVYRNSQPKVFSDNISYVKMDLRDCESSKSAVKGMDYILMFAANISRRNSDLSYLLSDLEINFQVLNAAHAAGVKKVVWLSSATAYSPSEIPLKEEQMYSADPADVYFGLGWTTRYIETLFRMYATKLNHSLEAVVLRSTAIYGEHDDFNLSTCHVLAALIGKVAQRQSPIEIWGTGQTRRDFIYVGDVVDACILALEKASGFAVFNIGSGKTYSVKELLEMVLAADNYSQAKIIYDKSKPAKFPNIALDCGKAKETIGFLSGTSIEDGIAKTIKWYRNNLLAEGKAKCSP